MPTYVAVNDPAGSFDNQAPKARPVLNSWKEVAVYLARGVRTVQRWERDLGLPVHRVRDTTHSPVFAFPSELDAWLQKRCIPQPRNVRSIDGSVDRGAGRTAHPELDRSQNLGRQLAALLSQQAKAAEQLRQNLRTTEQLRENLRTTVAVLRGERRKNWFNSLPDEEDRSTATKAVAS